MDSLPSPLPTALRELIRYVRPPWLRRWVRDGYGWVQPRLSPIARAALPPHLSVEYLEMTRGAIDFNRPGIPIVASLPSVHIADTYGRAHHGRAGTVEAITEWAGQHDVPLVDLKAAVAEHVMSGRGNPDGIHWNFEAHQAVAELMLKALAGSRCRARGSRASHGRRGGHRLVVAAVRRGPASGGASARCRCTSCATATICATASTTFPYDIHDRATRPPPAPRPPNSPTPTGRRWTTAAATAWSRCISRPRCRAPYSSAVPAARQFGRRCGWSTRRSAAMGVGFVALAAARAAAAGADLDAVEAAARSAVPRGHAFIVVHRLDNLRRSGRIGTAASWLGTALSLKPLLCLDVDGRLVLAQRIRTVTKAHAAMVEQVAEVVGERPATIAVHHVDNSRRRRRHCARR